MLGVGTGYRRVEYHAIGVDWEDRQERLVAAVVTMRRLWAGDDVVVAGRQIPSGCRLEPELWPRMVSGAKSVTGARLAGRLALGLLGASKQSTARLETVVAAHAKPVGRPR